MIHIINFFYQINVINLKIKLIGDGSSIKELISSIWIKVWKLTKFFNYI